MIIKQKNIPIPGLRNIKTAISILFCLLLYDITGREGIMLAVVAAIICMQDSVEKSFQAGKNRVFGTIMGGVFGTVFAYMNFAEMNYFVWLTACILGVILLIHIINIVEKQDSVVIGCIVFLIIVLEPGDETAIIYALHRVLDTLVGIVIAVGVNRYFFSPKPERVHTKKDSMYLNYDIVKVRNQRHAKWSGGTTREIFISPKYSLYGERDFNWRISASIVAMEESKFTKLPGYLRHIMALEGKMRLVHEGQHTINLEEFDQDFFSGDWDTNCYGVCKDFNLILKEGFVGLLECIYTGETEELMKRNFEEGIAFSQTGFYILKDGVNVSVIGEGKTLFNSVLNKGDFVVFNELDLFENDSLFVKIGTEVEGENVKEVAAIRVVIAVKSGN